MAEIGPDLGANPEPPAGATALELPVEQLTVADDVSADVPCTSSNGANTEATAALQAALTPAVSTLVDHSDNKEDDSLSVTSSVAGQAMISPGDSVSEVATEEALGSPDSGFLAEVASLVSEASDAAQTVAESIASPSSGAASDDIELCEAPEQAG